MGSGRRAKQTNEKHTSIHEFLRFTQSTQVTHSRSLTSETSAKVNRIKDGQTSLLKFSENIQEVRRKIETSGEIRVHGKSFKRRTAVRTVG